MYKQFYEINSEKEAFEAPTIALAFGVYGLWFGLTYWNKAFPAWLWLPLAACLLVLHLSLQHETVHGHPCRLLWLNSFIGTWPLALWRPYEVYRQRHIVHHFGAGPNEARVDPESRYLTPAAWARLGPWEQTFVRAESTLLGALTLGPAREPWIVWSCIFAKIAAGDRRTLGRGIRHALEVALVVYWLVEICHLSLTLYVAAAYAGTALERLRAFAQHLDDRAVGAQPSIVENAPILGVLFLYNNLHAAHHAQLALPWYRLPGFYRAYRQALLARNGGLVYDGYFDVARRYWRRPQRQTLAPISARG